MLLFVFNSGLQLRAQEWLPGYNFRKKITIDKTKVVGTFGLVDFPVLIELEASDLQFLNSCGHNSEAGMGLDISFAMVSAPLVPLNFQLDNYDAPKGKLSCWVKLQELLSGNSPGLNEIYLYYGSSQLHNPFSASAQATWPSGYHQVLHFNLDGLSPLSKSANQGPSKDARGSRGMGPGNFLAARIGTGVSFHTHTDVLFAGTDTNTTICISAWVNLAEIGPEQVLLSNDSLGNGYTVFINSAGRLVFETMFSGFKNSSTSVQTLSAGSWYYIALAFRNGGKKIYINGLYNGGGGSASIKMGRGGTLCIGRSKQNDRNFKGLIDELSLQHTDPGADWLLTAYRNQENPKAFVQVAAMESNPMQTIVASEFTGNGASSNWADAGNWSDGLVPGNDANIRIKAGKTLQLNQVPALCINQLVLEASAMFMLGSALEVNCIANIGTGATLLLGEGARLTFKQNVFNNGTIGRDESKGILIFGGGNLPVQTCYGGGSCTVSRLEINQLDTGQNVQLDVKVNVGNAVALIRGRLNTRGKLTLLSGVGGSASLAPVLQGSGITGDVNVQRFVEGSFPEPATARGWWLHASPVYQAILNGKPYHNLEAIKASVFVTGAAGLQNGFDPSPNNRATIYTHDQSLPGSLSQKYIPIPNMAAKAELGKGFYVFSRGERHVSNAYQQQIQGPVFSNPQSYTITYTGKLYTGELPVTLSNKNSGAEGDGFNLLGNPYASAIRWGSLQKNNAGPFVWTFDPKNNAYQVRDDPDYLIASGEGFFVRVNAGSTTGTLTFNELAKHVSVSSSGRPEGLASKKEAISPGTDSRLSVRLSNNGFSDTYALIFRKEGSNDLNDADAPKIGEGYLTLSGLAANGRKLSVEERRADTSRKEVRLYIKGWAGTGYSLHFRGDFNSNEQLRLTDRYLNVSKNITETDNSYAFSIYEAATASYGGDRFLLSFQREPEAISGRPTVFVYPNPSAERFYLKSAGLTFRNLNAVVRDLVGRTVCRCKIVTLEPESPTVVPCSDLPPGIYHLRLTDEKGFVIASHKLIKN